MGEDRSGVPGRAAPGGQGVLDAFAEGQVGDAGAAQLTVYHHGLSVADVWSAAPHPGPRPFGSESVSILMSVIRGLLAVRVRLLSERGALDVQAAGLPAGR
ncbi:hypothetical protein [Streptomyces sp. NPDC056661]|uniref:hypothetical protein n=1 Tax=Streptomyces sp. NPDC056661 TaxID=3345898 RepID=UPI0036A1946D